MELEKDVGNYLYDGLIVLSNKVTPDVLERYNLRVPDSRIDLAQYRLIREVHAGRASIPVLDEKT